MELRYMDAGEQGPKSANAGPEGTPGYHSHVSYHDIDHRRAPAALDGKDQRRPRDHGAGCGRLDRKPYLS